MRYLESYKDKYRRKVYWIIPFKSNKFEDAVVRTFIQYVEREREREIQRIELINDALELTQDAKAMLPESEYVLLSMEFEYDSDGELVMQPRFKIWEFEDKEGIEKDKYVFIGYINTNKEEVDIWLESNKYNL